MLLKLNSRLSSYNLLLIRFFRKFETFRIIFKKYEFLLFSALSTFQGFNSLCPGLIVPTKCLFAKKNLKSGFKSAFALQWGYTFSDCETQSRGLFYLEILAEEL
ncbi:hypothetical protein CH380_18340 [Leptospira adleri]|uniref:Uncharacterized protein n=1 Tax=Leptospira adleri TaxID=2023186 RepID=A0A2M9YK16_9LEPT|nr:hypothetical protein CH380_18340 [Leptospira adleri]PJZ59912.1 hypothetical protein CH376_21225 [Leptospira adleri]